jgi:hypothetical protein
MFPLLIRLPALQQAVSSGSQKILIREGTKWALSGRRFSRKVGE